MKYNSFYYQILRKITKFITSIHWMRLRSLFNNAKEFDLTYDEQREIETMMRNGNYFILTTHNAYLSTYLIGVMTYIKTKKWPDYCHILMNLDVGKKDDKEGFDLMEATNSGVHYSEFDSVFNCDNVCILLPKNIDAVDWALIMNGLSKQLGKEYDDLFDIKDSSRVSCVEMCLDALKELPNFETEFPHLSSMIKEVGNLTPQMYRDCQDFVVMYETKH